MRGIVKWSALFLQFFSLPAANAQTAKTVNGNINAAFAVGRWKESHEGVSVFCARITTPKDVAKGNSLGACFLTEAQAAAKDSVTMSTNMFGVTAGGEHRHHARVSSGGSVTSILTICVLVFPIVFAEKRISTFYSENQQIQRVF